MSIGNLQSRLWVGMLFAVCVPALAASPAVKSRGAADMEKVRGHQAAVVLLRVTMTIDGKRVDVARGGDANRLPKFFLANLDALSAPENVIPPSLTRAAADDGWRYLVLSPGTYFLLMLPPGMEQNPPAVAYSVETGRYGRLAEYALKQGRGGFWSADLGAFVFAKAPPPDFQALQGFWFEVPREREVVYVGSLSVTCKGGRGLFGSLLDSCSDFDLFDESDAARGLASAALAGLAFDTQPMAPSGHLRPGVQLLEPGKLPVAAHGSSGVGAAFAGARLAPSATIHGVGPAFSVFNLLVVGSQLLHESSQQRQAEQHAVEMQPCLDRLSAVSAGIDVSQAFAAALAAASKSAPAPAGDVPGAVLAAPAVGQHRWSVSLPIVRLRESGPSRGLALEIGLVVRLEDLTAGRLDGYSLWLSGPDPPQQSPRTAGSPLYTRLVPERAEPRSIDEWCGAGGGTLLSAEIARALQNIATQVASDVR